MTDDVSILNKVLDDAISSVLIDTADKFHLMNDPLKETDEESIIADDRNEQQHQGPRVGQAEEQQTEGFRIRKVKDNVENLFNVKSPQKPMDQEKLYRRPEPKQSSESSSSRKNVGKTCDQSSNESQTSQAYKRPETKQSSGSNKLQNVGKMYNFTPPEKEEPQQSIESFQDKYERFRSQRKPSSDQDQISNNYESRKEEVRPGESSRAEDGDSFNEANKYRDVNKPEARPATDDRVETQQPQSKEDRTDGDPVEEAVEEEERIEKPIVVTRGMWGALPTTETIPRRHAQADTVVFSMNTNTSPCDTPNECMRRVREIQARHMGEGLGDIQYSFLLGGDGYIYEGRGWEYESGAKAEAEEGSNYNIAFIGKFKQGSNVSKLPVKMMDNAQNLVMYLHSSGLLNGTRVRNEQK